MLFGPKGQTMSLIEQSWTAKKTGCDEYLEDQLNVASKELEKIRLMKNMVKNIWKIFAP